MSTSTPFPHSHQSMRLFNRKISVLFLFKCTYAHAILSDISFNEAQIWSAGLLLLAIPLPEWQPIWNGKTQLSFECGIRIWHSWEALFDMSCRALFVLLISDLLCEPYGRARAYCDTVIWFQGSRQDVGLLTDWKPSSIGCLPVGISPWV